MVDFSTSAGCGTFEPSLPEPIEFWKKHVRPVFGLWPIMAMSVNVFVLVMPWPSSATLRQRSSQCEPLSFFAVTTIGPGWTRPVARNIPWSAFAMQP